jgi:hypothetical protein
MSNETIKPPNSLVAAFSVIILLVSQFICGFVAWTLYQIAAMHQDGLPSVSLITGMAFWFLWVLMVIVPVYMAGIMVTVSSNKK